MQLASSSENSSTWVTIVWFTLSHSSPDVTIQTLYLSRMMENQHEHWVCLLVDDDVVG